MSEPFDPYYEWLGIPPTEQPVHLYRLLGLALFESNERVIEQAADRQMAHLKTHQIGTHSRESQRLLNEVANARQTLLRPEKRAAYERQLRKQLAAAETSEAVPPPPVQPAPDPSAPTPSIHIATDRSSERPARRSNPGIAIGVGGLCVVAAVVGVVLLGGGTPPPDPVKPAPGPTAANLPPVLPPAVAKRDVPPSPAVPARPPVPQVETKSNLETKVAPPVTPPVDPVPPPTSDPPPTASPGTPPIEVSPEARLTAAIEAAGAQLLPHSPAAPADRLPIPAAGARERALKVVRELFAAEFAKADTAAQRGVLVQKLLDTAEKTADDPAGQYVLVEEALRLAEEMGDPELGSKIIDDAAARFEVDPLARRAAFVRAASKRTKFPAIRRKLAEAMLPVVRQAAERRQFDAAAELATAAIEVARESGDGLTIKHAVEGEADLARRRADDDKLQSALKSLASNPREPAASALVGRKLLALEQWEPALTLLQHGADPVWAPLAARDLTSRTTSADQVALADAWLAASEAAAKAKQPDQALFLERAYFWYGKSVPQLTGLNKVKVEARLKENPTLAAKHAALPETNPGTVPAVASSDPPTGNEKPPSERQPGEKKSGDPRTEAKLQAGLVAHWPLDDGQGAKPRDASPGQRPLAVLGEAPSWTTDRATGARTLELDGRTCLAVPDLGQHAVATFALWVRPAELPGDGFQALFHDDGWNREGIVHMHLNAHGTVGLGVFGVEVANAQGSATDVRSKGHLTVGAWQHVAVVYDSLRRKAQVYIGGQLDAEYEYTRAVPLVLGPARLGSWSGMGGSRWLRGGLAEVRLYNRALSAAEIAALAKSPDNQGRR